MLHKYQASQEYICKSNIKKDKKLQKIIKKRRNNTKVSGRYGKIVPYGYNKAKGTSLMVI